MADKILNYLSEFVMFLLKIVAGVIALGLLLFIIFMIDRQVFVETVYLGIILFFSACVVLYLLYFFKPTKKPMSPWEKTKYLEEKAKLKAREDFEAEKRASRRWKKLLPE